MCFTLKNFLKYMKNRLNVMRALYLYEVIITKNT